MLAHIAMTQLDEKDEVEQDARVTHLAPVAGVPHHPPCGAMLSTSGAIAESRGRVRTRIFLTSGQSKGGQVRDARKGEEVGREGGSPPDCAHPAPVGEALCEDWYPTGGYWYRIPRSGIEWNGIKILMMVWDTRMQVS